ncbi:MAG: uroporphyrinogen-III synthase [Pseudomonadota bacterium]
MPDSLRDWRIVLTRPTGQNEALAARIRAAGGEVILLPLLDIAPPAAPLSVQSLHAQLARSDWAIFISPNAVRMALRVLPAADWPTTLRLAAIGQGTARTLREAGLGEALAPAAGADSESLLALAEFAQPSGRRILLVRGEGGRELLAQTLTERGASVEHAVVYRRLACPPGLPALRQQIGGERTLWVITSSEALRVLLGAAQHAADAAWLCAQDFVFAHPRIAELGAKSGLNRGMIAPSPEDDAVFKLLMSLTQKTDLAPSPRQGGGK